ncbi:branched-chain amino acid ABC transporter substrate-binding protein (plasmid) [Mesorhizobium sp. 131-3-5]|uniref:ABC transporter substrate-binding protein n=1 Tax=Mesorhizobium sp. 131-3-5 TaxID=2744520 RepID=UPI0018EBAC74|nr:ABC transporter substrate-binding protein [Mesorhizobium sp. 131-3-5]BCH12344.1 branched-chain amino acid ABC transporter substrate-binding protein [Mesorhizobium sp. 131-3-5]
MLKLPLFSLLSVTLAAQPVFAGDDPITIGFAIAKSGWMQPYDYASRTAEMAIDDINQKGGLLGRQIKIVSADTKTDPAEGVRAATDVIDQGSDLVVVSCDYDQGAPAALAAVGAGKLAFSLCAGDPKMGIEGVGRQAFTASHAAQTQGAVMADWGFAKKEFKTAYVLLDNSIEFTKSACQGFEYRWNQLEGTTIVGRDTFKNSDASISSQITRLKSLASAPDAIMLCTYPPGGASAVRQLRAAGIETPILMTMGMDGSYWLPAVPDLKNAFLPAIGLASGPDPDPKINNLIERYRKAYGEPPATAFIFYGYALVELWARAVERAKTTDTEAVLAELEKMKDEDTAIGPMSFSDQLHIQNKGRYLIIGIQDGKSEPLGYWNSPEIPKEVILKQ